MMEIQLISEELPGELHRKVRVSERHRHNFDLRTRLEDGSQRMLNALEIGIQGPVYQPTD